MGFVCCPRLLPRHVPPGPCPGPAQWGPVRLTAPLPRGPPSLPAALRPPAWQGPCVRGPRVHHGAGCSARQCSSERLLSHRSPLAMAKVMKMVTSQVQTVPPSWDLPPACSCCQGRPGVSGLLGGREAIRATGGRGQGLERVVGSWLTWPTHRESVPAPPLGGGGSGDRGGVLPPLWGLAPPSQRVQVWGGKQT